MGDISIIARRLKDGHVQYGWSGNGGYFRMVGTRLLEWYKETERVEYLFSLGQLRLIGAPNSEYGGYAWIDTHDRTGTPHHLGVSENDIFSKIAFIDYGYFYDIDDRWYYIIPHSFTIKVPLDLIAKNVDDRGYEFDYRNNIDKELLKYILTDYLHKDEEFHELIREKGYDVLQLLEKYGNEEYILYEFSKKCPSICGYFDDWVVAETDEECTKLTGFKMKKKTERHIETFEW